MNTGDPILDAWPNCPTPDCGNKVCAWTGTGVCFPCSERLITRAEVIRRYNATHDMTWDEAEAADRADDESAA
jgi:hypothetical protein